MHENMATDHQLLCNDKQSQKISYGCLFCITGKEQSVADQIQAACSNVRTTTMRQLKYKTCKKIKTQEETILLPSYEFFEAPSSMEPSIEFPTQNVIRILSVEKGISFYSRDIPVWLGFELLNPANDREICDLERQLK